MIVCVPQSLRMELIVSTVYCNMYTVHIYAVVTFSVGVLQSGIVTFQPEPPMSWTYTLHRGTMAHFLRIHVALFLVLLATYIMLKTMLAKFIQP